VSFAQQALVMQHSGEPWDAIALTISTARPALATSLPDDPAPWYLDGAQPEPSPGRAMLRAAAPLRMAHSAAAAFPMAGPDMVEEEAAFQAAQWEAPEAERMGTAQAFHVADGADVPSDGEPHVFGVGNVELPCRLEHVVMPAEAEGAHLRAVATNTTGRVLLPGPLHVFYTLTAGDQFVGATHVQFTAEGSDLTLYLGRDDNVTVKRQLVERDTDKGTLLQRGVRVVTLGYRMTLVNRTATPQRVLVKDSLPLARHEKIKVRPLDVRPQPTERTKLEQLTWDLTLAPAETRQLDWRCAVESPADLQVTPMP
jgi:uncharacterized protein (TIGR02231 family)